MVRRVTAAVLAEMQNDGAQIQQKNHELNKVLLKVEQVSARQRSANDQLQRELTDLKKALGSVSVDTKPIHDILARVEQSIAKRAEPVSYEFTFIRDSKTGFTKKIVATPTA